MKKTVVTTLILMMCGCGPRFKYNIDFTYRSEKSGGVDNPYPKLNDDTKEFSLLSGKIRGKLRDIDKMKALLESLRYTVSISTK